MDFQALASDEIAALVKRLSTAAAETRDQAVTAAVATAQSAYSQALEGLTAEHAAALQKAEAEYQGQVQQAQAERDAAVAKGSEQDARLAAAEQDRDKALKELEQAHKAAVAELADKHDAAVKDLTVAHDAVVAELNVTQQQMAEHASRQLAFVKAENDRLVSEFTALEMKQAELLAAQAKLQDSRGPLLAHLGAASARIAAGATTADVLAAAAHGLSYDFSRVAAFEVHDQRLNAVHQKGFGDKMTLERLSASRSDHALLAKALQSAEARLYAPAETAAPGFAGKPGTMLAVSITVRGEAVAVLYADDGGAGSTAPKDDCVTLATVLQQQAALRLDRLMIEMKAGAELRAYATMLIDEAEYVYNSDVAAGKSDQERLAGLQENIRCARQIFAQRITAEGPAAASLLDDVVAERLRTQSGSGFANDLGHLLLQGDLESNAA